VTIRLEILMPGQMDADTRTRVQLVAAGLPEVRRTVISYDRKRVTWYAGEMSVERAQTALREAGVAFLEVRTGLAPDSDAQLAAPPGERFRPIGR
jgi:hypothetical protein